MESRILGPIELDGGAGGGAMEGLVPYADSSLPLRLEIDYPDRLTQAAVDQIDATLERLEIPDRMARDAIAAQVERNGSAPAQLFAAWQKAADGDPGAFLSQLRPTAMIFAPDGGRSNPYPLVIRYGVDDPAIAQEITVRLPSRPTGPEVDRSLRAR